MPAKIELVIDEILGHLRTYWEATADVEDLDDVPVLVFESDNSEAPPDGDLPYVKVYIRHNSTSPPTLGGVGQRRYERYGSVYMNIFVPFQEGMGVTIAQRLAQVARDAYEGTRTDSAWFRSCRLNEAGRDGPWYQINVTADFCWEEVK